MVKIRQNLVKSSIANKMTFNGTNPCDYIVVHQTANTSKGANAEMHGRLQANGNSRQASWHYQVDDKEAVQSFKDTAQCWHAGNANYNKKSIGVEICVNSDGNYKKAVANAIELVKHLMTKHNIPAKNVIRHHDASGKHCPREIMNGKEGITWNNFKAQLSGKGDVEPSTPTPSKPSTSKPASNNAKLIKNEDAYFLATTNIKVRNAPSTKATHTGTLKKGDSIHYYKVYEGNGYRWLQYVGNSGNKLYLPYRESGSGKEQWGTFHSSRPKGTTTKKIAEDGWFGKDTAKLAQQVYKMKYVDGVISGQPNNASTRNIPAAKFGSSGSNLIREMQKEFGIPAKYRDGKITNPSMLIGAMQKYYGTPVDKKVSGPSMVIKEWQKALNKGKRK